MLLQISQAIGVAPDIGIATRPFPRLLSASHQPFPSTLSLPLRCLSPPLRRLAFPPYRVIPAPHLPPPPPMAATASGSWMCGECGKVCRSCGGLTKHLSTHKKGSRVGGVGDNLHRVYHATLDSWYPIHLTHLFLTFDLFQGNLVAKTAHFSHPEHHPSLPLPNLMTTGLPSRREPASRRPRYSTPQHHFQIVLPTYSSTSGMQP